jgi:prepilin-type N-terminal cleavage/methylation domain-containing protein
MPAFDAGHRRHGFTLIELTIVIMTIGILAAAAAPKYRDSLVYYRLDAAARRIGNDLRYARQYARKSCKVQSLSFSVASDNYTTTTVQDMNRRGTGFTVNLATEYSVDVITADFGGSPTLQFDIFGRPNQAGTVVIQSNSTQLTITLDSAGQVTTN